MDGHFVPNLTIGPDVVAAVRRHTGLPLDVHLMIESPELWVDRFVEAGASIVTVHQEACRHLDYVVSVIHRLGARAGVSLNPATPVGLVQEALRDVDLVLVMTVNPGFGGQKLIPGTIDKVHRMAALIADVGASPEIEVDGGISPENADLLVRAGATVLVAGSSIFNSRGSVEENSERAEALRGRCGQPNIREAGAGSAGHILQCGRKGNSTRSSAACGDSECRCEASRSRR